MKPFVSTVERLFVPPARVVVVITVAPATGSISGPGNYHFILPAIMAGFVVEICACSTACNRGGSVPYLASLVVLSPDVVDVTVAEGSGPVPIVLAFRNATTVSVERMSAEADAEGSRLPHLEGRRSNPSVSQSRFSGGRISTNHLDPKGIHEKCSLRAGCWLPPG